MHWTLPEPVIESGLGRLSNDGQSASNGAGPGNPKFSAYLDYVLPSTDAALTVVLDSLARSGGLISVGVVERGCPQLHQDWVGKVANSVALTLYRSNTSDIWCGGAGASQLDVRNAVDQACEVTASWNGADRQVRFLVSDEPVGRPETVPFGDWVFAVGLCAEAAVSIASTHGIGVTVAVTLAATALGEGSAEISCFGLSGRLLASATVGTLDTFRDAEPCLVAALSLAEGVPRFLLSNGTLLGRDQHEDTIADLFDL